MNTIAWFVRLLGREHLFDMHVIGNYCRYGLQLTAGSVNLTLDTPWKVCRFPLKRRSL